jgi:hypothetical protein
VVDEAAKLGNGVKKTLKSISPHDRPQAVNSRAAMKKLAGKVLRETGGSVSRQLVTTLKRLGKSDSDDDQSDRIASDLDLGLLSGLSAVHPWIEDAATDRAQD